MSTQTTPHPMPPSMRTTVNMALGDRQLGGLDNNGRFIIRRLVAEAYAEGFRDGGFDQADADRTDRQAAQDAAKRAEEES